MEYLVTFLEGIASFISPCVLPMIPIYLSYFTGQDNKTNKKTLINSIGFVIGFTLIFVLMGILASSFGILIKQNQDIIQIIFGILIILFGLNMIEILKIPILNKSLKLNYNRKKFNFITSLIFGMFFSIGWTPCVGMFLGSALMMASNEAHLLKGVILLICYSIGLGIPFILSSLLIEKLKNVFTWIKEHYKVINTISGLFLIIIGILMIFQISLKTIQNNKLENTQEENKTEMINQINSYEEKEEGGKIMNVTSENFEEEVLKSKVPVLVDFWASWCGPCKMMAPVVEEIAKDMGNNAKVCKVNIDEEADLATKYGIMSIPTFLIFRDGKVADSTLGVQDKQKIINLLK